MSKNPTTADSIIPAWFMAVTHRPITEELISHSDRGVQYACDDFTKILKANKLITRSMSRKGNYWDNAVAKSFIKTIKIECIYTRIYSNRTQAML